MDSALVLTEYYFAQWILGIDNNDHPSKKPNKYRKYKIFKTNKKFNHKKQNSQISTQKMSDKENKNMPTHP